MEKYHKIGGKDVEDALRRLDIWAQRVAQMAAAEARRGDNEMKDVDDNSKVEVVNRTVPGITHSSQQSGTKPGHESPRGGGPWYEQRSTCVMQTSMTHFISYSS